MRKKKMTILLVSIMVAVASIVGITFAVWSEVNNVSKDVNNTSGDWNESAKYLVYTLVMSGDEQIGYKVTGYTGLIANVAVPSQYNGLNVIEIDRAFVQNSVVQEIIIPETVKSIASNSFANCTRLIKITIKGGAEDSLAIGEYAFAGASNLASFVSSRNITSIGDNAFLGCSSLVAIPVVA